MSGIDWWVSNALAKNLRVVWTASRKPGTRETHEPVKSTSPPSKNDSGSAISTTGSSSSFFRIARTPSTSCRLAGSPGRQISAMPLHTTAQSSTRGHWGCCSSGGISMTSSPTLRRTLTYSSNSRLAASKSAGLSMLTTLLHDFGSRHTMQWV